jgi:hypothetical protein
MVIGIGESQAAIVAIAALKFETALRQAAGGLRDIVGIQHQTSNPSTSS